MSRGEKWESVGGSDRAASVLLSGEGLRADARRNRARVIEVARSVFSERGPDARMEEIAEGAGVGVGTLYRNFPSKEALLAEVVAWSVGKLARAAQDSLAQPDPWEAFEDVVRLLVRTASEQRAFAHAAPWGEEQGVLYEARRELDRWMGEMVRRAQQAATLRPDITELDLFVLFGGVINAPAHVSADRRDRCLSVILDGLRHRFDA
ncbi:MAG: TetR/AcrR family transcriptional regulator, partial [Chloroflexota bacterium]|nr:TetR/AcrR family transcriptional regulator [Chloroflexota bacterium]